MQLGAAAGAGLAVPWVLRSPAARAANSLRIDDISVVHAGTLRRYVEPLPVPGDGIMVAAPTAPNHYAFTQREISRQLHPALPATPLWAYDDGSGLGGQAGSFGIAVVAA